VSLETDVVAVLQAQCPRVFPSTAPMSTTRPFVTWDHIGGDPLRYMDGTGAAQRMAMLQVNVWADTKASAVTLMLAIEEALCTAGAFTCSPSAALQSRFEEDADLYGALQDFQVLGVR
jgi:hypothetical protein